ncbi:LTA synthase family protein [Enterococcus cecorum]|uniref:LTA synthase family protein n=1 Tax=Enterococcus cecorum TaxID=44008 RepID=UPI0007618E34|nr:LTA synthase family protein [Enterococcus cecorum]MDZ5505256.1 LTA synthase family protein [Enterococcus cecorum]MDZ5532693.1 LTA synthase family protein [Enterococcus cecorum]MDZ5545896.1 LTA synthase family protein [Enterococcus cecorum]MDZ5547753.1 LTA synthase family protein [Enterococcus cecorum]MDZ5552663.1 LTA synthase family protein [Enterococcus cecorum]
MKKKNYFSWVNKRLGFFGLLLVLMWIKNMLAYTLDFHLSLENALQHFILIINPIATTLLLLSVGLYVRRKKPAYITMMVIYFIMTALLFSNAVYYREFTDFITINTMLGAGKVASGLGESAIKLFRPYDILYWLDFILLVFALATKRIKMDETPVRARMAFAFSTLAVMIFSGNLFLAESDRPELLTRTFSRDYLVKYLGINAFTAYDGVQTYKTTQVRAQASATDMDEVAEYVKGHYAKPNDQYFGLAKGRNVIYIHLESTQQFLIDYKLKDENGVEHEVMPFINSLYHSNSTFSFSNFFHQVKAGKTSDSETLFENSLFGLNQGALFTQLGGKNTFEAAPNILKQTQGYTSAVFHGNSGTFWNRNETYKHLGYDYFFDASYYDVTEDNSFQYGLNDKPFFQQSVKYLEHLQQPFYTKFIAVSNHYPYSQLSGDETGFPLAQTKDETINSYFSTANYMDTAVHEFFDYLKQSGLYDNSIIILYGDHYGISNARNKELAQLLGKDRETWSNFDNAQVQRVPYMIHIPGMNKGKIIDTYGGQVDALPTLLHLLGVDTQNYIQLGQDLFSPDHKQLVAFRDGDFVTPNHTYYGGVLYDNKTGEEITEPSEELKKQIDADKDAVSDQLATSDKINNGDLLRFYTKSGLKAINPDDYNYLKNTDRIEKIEKELGDKSTSVYSKHNHTSTTDKYQTKSYQELHPKETSSSTSSENE